METKGIKTLMIVKDILERENIRYWLDCGTLLCCYRDGSLEYEHDVDVGLFIQDYPKIVKLENEFRERIGDFSKLVWDSRNPIAHAWTYGDPIDGGYERCGGQLLYYYPFDEFYVIRGTYVYHAILKKTLEEFSSITFRNARDENLRNIEFCCPKDAQTYLELVFGEEDWKRQIGATEYNKMLNEFMEKKREPYPAHRYIPKVEKWRNEFTTKHFDGRKYYE